MSLSTSAAHMKMLPSKNFLFAAFARTKFPMEYKRLCAWMIGAICKKAFVGGPNLFLPFIYGFIF
jgi:hypothetical protein